MSRHTASILTTPSRPTVTPDDVAGFAVNAVDEDREVHRAHAVKVGGGMISLRITFDAADVADATAYAERVLVGPLSGSGGTFRATAMVEGVWPGINRPRRVRS